MSGGRLGRGEDSYARSLKSSLGGGRGLFPAPETPGGEAPPRESSLECFSGRVWGRQGPPATLRQLRPRLPSSHRWPRGARICCGWEQVAEAGVSVRLGRGTVETTVLTGVGELCPALTSSSLGSATQPADPSGRLPGGRSDSASAAPSRTKRWPGSSSCPRESRVAERAGSRGAKSGRRRGTSGGGSRRR